MPNTPESIEHDVAQWLGEADSRFQKLLTKILHEPGQVTQSVLTHLGKDAAVWHNSLTFLSRKESPGMAEAMLLMAEVIRTGKAQDIFEVRELTEIARMSMGTWLSGKHNDQVTLRKKAAVVLGEMLDDPERRPRAMAALKNLEDASIPEPLDILRGEGAQKKELLLKAMEEAIQEMKQESDSSEWSMGQAIVDVVEADLTSHYLNDSDFGTAVRMMDGDDAHSAIPELISRLAARMMDRSVFEAWKPHADGPKGPKP